MNNIIELTNVNKYWLDEINKIRDYFNNEIKERKDIIKKLNKYLVSFDYLDKISIALSASFGTLSIASYASVVGTPAGIAGSSFTLIFTISTGISKSLLNVTKKRKKKHNKIIALAENKLNTIDTLLSNALNDSEISHEEFTNIINEANIYENIKENIKQLTVELITKKINNIIKIILKFLLIFKTITWTFTRHKAKIKEFKRTGDTRYIYRNELDKTCFQHDSAYADHKNLINRTEADKVLRDKEYDIASNPKYDGYQRGLASMVYKFFVKKSRGGGS